MGPLWLVPGALTGLPSRRSLRRRSASLAFAWRWCSLSASTLRWGRGEAETRICWRGSVGGGGAGRRGAARHALSELLKRRRLELADVVELDGAFRVVERHLVRLGQFCGARGGGGGGGGGGGRGAVSGEEGERGGARYIRARVPRARATHRPCSGPTRGPWRAPASCSRRPRGSSSSSVGSGRAAVAVGSVGAVDCGARRSEAGG